MRNGHKGVRFLFQGHRRKGVKKIRGRKPKRINQLDMSHKLVASFPSIVEAAEQTGVQRSSIIHCLKKRYRSAGGYIWEYAN